MHLDLFEKRSKVYFSLLLGLANDMGDASLNQEQRDAAIANVEAARFLFPDDATQLIRNLQATIAAYGDAKRRWNALRDKPLDDETNASASKMNDLRQRYERQLKELSEKMALLMPYGHIKS